MKVILLQDVKKLGQKDDIVNVADGHAHNYLIPKGLAVEANKGKLTEIKKQKDRKLEMQEQEEKKAKDLAEKLKQVKVTIPVKVGDAGKLFGAVSNKDIAQLLNQQHKINLDKKKVVLKDPIKTLGTYQVTVKLHPKVHTKLDVEVVGE
ncbi:MAG: 50S ribosomal protein L9 [Firmicutes bacterium]|nr:50S ribosomal protein L9 [Bacillota bacterium]